MDDDIKQMTIQITEVSVNDGRYSVKGTPLNVRSDSNELSFSFFENKKSDGQPTKAFKQWKSKRLTVGATVSVNYKESPNKRNPDYPYRNILWFDSPSQPEEEEEEFQYDSVPEHPSSQQLSKNTNSSYEGVDITYGDNTPQTQEKPLKTAMTDSERVLERILKGLHHVAEQINEVEGRLELIETLLTEDGDEDDIRDIEW